MNCQNIAKYLRIACRIKKIQKWTNKTNVVLWSESDKTKIPIFSNLV